MMYTQDHVWNLREQAQTDRPCPCSVTSLCKERNLKNTCIISSISLDVIVRQNKQRKKNMDFFFFFALHLFVSAAAQSLSVTHACAKADLRGHLSTSGPRFLWDLPRLKRGLIRLLCLAVWHVGEPRDVRGCLDAKTWFRGLFLVLAHASHVWDTVCVCLVASY
jgi:hypothetical protein